MGSIRGYHRAKFGEEPSRNSNDIPADLVELATAISRESTPDDVGIFEKAAAPWYGTRVHGIAKVARKVRTPTFGLLLHHCISNQLRTHSRTDETLTSWWNSVISTYSRHRTLLYNEEGADITECVLAGRGMLEAYFLDLQAALDQRGEKPHFPPYEDMDRTFRKAYVDSVAIGDIPPSQRNKKLALLLLSLTFDFPDYERLDIGDAAGIARTICSLIDDIQYQNTGVPADEDLSMEDPNAWYSLGCIYIHACNHVAEQPVPRSELRQLKIWHACSVPLLFLRQALHCFSQGHREKLSQYGAWFYNRIGSRSADLDAQCVIVGNELKRKAKSDLDIGQAAWLQDIHLRTILGRKQQTRGRETKTDEGGDLVSNIFLVVVCLACILVLVGRT